MKRTLYIPLIGMIACLLWSVSCQSPTSTPTEKGMEEGTATASFVSQPVAVPKQEVTTLEVGAKAPDFRLPGADGKFYELSDFAASEVLVIIFTCNHCPTAQAYEDRMIEVHKEYKPKGVELIAISPNSELSLLYEELGYSDMADTYEEMAIRLEDKGFEFPYLYDGDDHAVSLQYGPVATPHAYVFDKDRKLQYVGRIDGSEKPGTANAEDLRGAIDAVLAGEPIAESSTKSFGCSVKWAWKNEYKIKVEEDWAKAEVSIEEIDEAGIKALLANDSDKLRLINVWATWCGPCVLEYPDFVEIHRMYKGRDFEFISLSADRLEHKDQALKFLTEKNSALTNYIFTNDDKYALIEAIDPDWNGALPYTVMVEPGGKRAYRVEGTIDPLELKKAIVSHEMIGRYY